MHKSDKTYNKEHINEKRKCNQLFLDKINPKTILDVFSGEGTPEYKLNKYTVISNDISKDVTADYHLDYLKFLCLMYSENRKFDYVDLDPFGSAYDGFDLAIKMANKGLAITLGEMGHVRWKRLDFVKYRYDITCIKDFTSDNLIKKIKEIGRRNHKDLEVYLKKDWHNISRVWFIINPYKETSQWENKDKEEQKTLFN